MFINRFKFENRIINKIEDMSYIIYLIHQNIGFLIIYHSSIYVGYNIFLVLFTILFILFLSFIFCNYLEKKIQSYIICKKNIIVDYLLIV